MSTHTAGPWKAYRKLPHQDFIEIVHSQNRAGVASMTVARVTVRPTWQQEQEANARLIAAAPEMLEALKALHERYVACIGNEGPEALAARTVIAKAEDK